MKVSELRLLLRDLFALLPGFRQADGDRLLAAFDLPGFPAGSAFCLAPFVAMHFAFDVAARAPGVFPFGFLRHVPSPLYYFVVSWRNLMPRLANLKMII